MKGLLIAGDSRDVTKASVIGAGRSHKRAEKSISLQTVVRSVFVGSVYICSQQLARGPFFLFISAITFFAAAIFCALNRPWLGRKITNRAALKMCESGLLLLLVLSLWSFGLKHLGPLRTLLVEGAELPVLYLITVAVRRQAYSKRKIQGVGMLFLAYLLVALDASWTVPSREINFRVAKGVQTRLHATSHRIQEMRHRFRRGHRVLLNGEQNEGEVEAPALEQELNQEADTPAPLAEVADAGNAEASEGTVVTLEHSFGPFLGVMAVTCAFLTRHAMTESTEQLSVMVGGSRRQISLSLFAAAVISSPLGLTSVVRSRHDLSWISDFSTSLLAALALLVMPYYFGLYAPADAFSQFSASSATILFVVITNAVLGFDADGGISFLLALAFPLCVLGLWLMLDSERQFPDFSDAKVAVHGLGGELSKLVGHFGSAHRYLRAYIKDTREHRESWQLLSFLLFQGFMVIVEAIYGRCTGSLGLLTVSSDSLLCCCALCISLLGTHLMQTRPPTSKFSYGFDRLEPLCAFVNCVLLVFVGVLVFLDSMERHIEGGLVEENRVLVVTFIGCLCNCLGLIFFPLEGSNLSTRGAFSHILANTLTSGGLFLSTAIRRSFGTMWVDRFISCVVSVVVFACAIPLMLTSADRLLLSVPVNKTKAFLSCQRRIKEQEYVTSLQCFHVWALTSKKLVVSIRVVIRDEGNPQQVKLALRSIAQEEFQHADIVVQVMKELLFHTRTHVKIVTLEGNLERKSSLLL